MRRRLGLVIAALLALVAGMIVGSQENGDSAQAATTAPKPNIVVIETDDQTVAELELLPSVKQLIGDQGVTFDNNFASFSLCCPSRS